MPEAIRYILSHPLSPATPTWLDNPRVVRRAYTRIDDGEVCNQTVYETLTHNGTHVDASYHFDNAGRRITDYPPESWLFTTPVVVDVARQDGELIRAAELEPLSSTIAGADLVLFRTGFEQMRGDAVRFGTRAPGFAADAASVLRSFSGLRAIGMDFPSASSPLHLDEGVAFHQAVLADQPATSGTRGILLIEDMHLNQDLDGMEWVLVAPLMLDGADGSQVTVFAG